MAIDRTVLPEVFEISGLKLADINHTILSNGVSLYTINHGDIDICKISLIWEEGKYDVADSWALSIMSAMLLNGTKQHTSDEITEIFDFYGSKVGCSCNPHTTRFTLTALNRTLSDLLPLVLEILQFSNFPQKEIDAKIRKFYANESLKRKTVQYQSLTLCNNLLYPQTHPAVVCEKDINGLKSVTREDVIKLYNQVIISQRPTIFVAGNITSEVLDLIKTTFESLNYTNAAISQNVIPFTQNCNYEMRKLSMPDQVQSSLDVIIPSIDCHSEDYHKIKLALVVLGGYFGSRLNKIIREEKGLTYGITANHKNTLEGGYISINSQCAGRNVEQVIEEIKYQMEILKNEIIPEEELTSVRRFYLSALSATSENLFNTLDFYISCYLNKISFDNFAARENVVHTITAIDIKETAKKYFDTNKMLIGVAGDV